MNPGIGRHRAPHQQQRQGNYCGDQQGFAKTNALLTGTVIFRFLDVLWADIRQSKQQFFAVHTRIPSFSR